MDKPVDGKQSEPGDKDLVKRWPRIKMRNGKLTSQTAFEENHPTLPEGFVGFFAYHFEVSCHKDIANLKELIGAMKFARGCKELGNEIEWTPQYKINFLLKEIKHWDKRKYWPTGSVVALCAAVAAVVGSCIESVFNADSLVKSIEDRLSDGLSRNAPVKLDALLSALRGAASDSRGLQIIISLTIALCIFVVATLILEWIHVSAQRKVWTLREALLLLKHEEDGGADRS